MCDVSIFVDVFNIRLNKLFTFVMICNSLFFFFSYAAFDLSFIGDNICFHSKWLSPKIFPMVDSMRLPYHNVGSNISTLYKKKKNCQTFCNPTAPYFGLNCKVISIPFLFIALLKLTSCHFIFILSTCILFGSDVFFIEYLIRVKSICKHCLLKLIKKI